MNKITITFPYTELRMNDFPGWINEADWQKIFKRKDTTINSIFFKYSQNPEELKLKTENPYSEIIEGSANYPFHISKLDIKEGLFEVDIDKKTNKVLLKIEGDFEIDTSSWSNDEIELIKKQKYFLADGFNFHNSKGNSTKAQGHFTDSWDKYVAIEVKIK